MRLIEWIRAKILLVLISDEQRARNRSKDMALDLLHLVTHGLVKAHILVVHLLNVGCLSHAHTSHDRLLARETHLSRLIAPQVLLTRDLRLVAYMLHWSLRLCGGA